MLTEPDRKPFAQMLGAVASLYGRELSRDLLAIYWQALAPYDLAQVRRALDRHVRNPDAGQYMPKPADLLRMLDGTPTDAAMSAWAKVERAIRLVGGNESVVFDDPLIHRCIADLGGWIRLCETKTEDMPFRARDFQTMYAGFHGRRELPPFPPALAGRFEAYNGAHGHAVDPPVLIGDQEACRAVLAGGQTSHLQIFRQNASGSPPGCLSRPGNTNIAPNPENLSEIL